MNKDRARDAWKIQGIMSKHERRMAIRGILHASKQKRFPEANTPLKRAVKLTRYYVAYALTRLAYWIDSDGEFNAAFMREDKR